MSESQTVAERRRYAITSVKEARLISRQWLTEHELENAVTFGLPEVDDRYHVWRVPLLSQANHERVGEVVIDAYTTLLLKEQTTAPEIMVTRLLGRHSKGNPQKRKAGRKNYLPSNLRNTIACGDSEALLQDFPAQSVDLIFTSPPYYNARPAYEEYATYEEYLWKMRRIIQESHRVLNEGRMFAINVSPVLIRRPHRGAASRRLALPFELHHIFMEEGYDFLDDIIWVKPEGAGWATGRGRRFAADRSPLQYKPVPVTEYVLVYRKHTDRLIDWNIRSYPRDVREASKIADGYERTNIWRIKPAHDSRHPAIFPLELAEKIIRYYSFINDVVLDPFAGIGTTGAAAARLKRRFVLLEKESSYVDVIREEAKRWLGKKAATIQVLNADLIDVSDRLF